MYQIWMENIFDDSCTLSGRDVDAAGERYWKVHATFPVVKIGFVAKWKR